MNKAASTANINRSSKSPPKQISADELKSLILKNREGQHVTIVPVKLPRLKGRSAHSPRYRIARPNRLKHPKFNINDSL